TFAPGETTKTVTVKVNGDLLDELDETFFLRLLNPVDATIADGEGIGTILDDDAEPSISIDDVSVSEGNTGTRTARFTVALSAPSGKTITVAFATASATATAGGDYVSTNGTLTVAPGQASKNVDVTVNGDTVVEADETYHVNLTAPSNATVADGDGLGTITNDDANRAPVLAPVGDQIVQAGEILVVPISATDPDGDAITLSASNLPPFASLTDDGDGTGHLRLAPSLPDVGTYLGVVVSASDSSGADTVTIKITVKPPPPPGPPNNPPYAVDDVASARGAPVEIAVLANDSDVDGDNLSIVEVVQPQHGGVTCGSSRCTYTPSPGFSGPSDTFTYTASDGRGGTAKARVVVRIRANKSPIALDDEAMTHGTKAQMIRVLLNDLDPEGDTLTVSPFGPGPSHGTVSCVSSGCWYAAAAGFTGDDTFAYQISDGHGGEATATVRVTVEVNQKPTAQDDAALAHGLGSVAISVLVNDFDPDGDELSIVNVGQPQLGSVTCGVTCTYTPPTTPPVGGYPFTATFTYAISDGLADEQPPATVSVLVLENHAPMAVDDRMTAPAVDPGFEASGTLAPLGNDYDVDGDVLDIVDWTQPEEGGGSVVCYHPPFRPWLCDYTAQPGFLGDDSFTYTITDYHGKAATATIDVTVLPNRPPEARPDAGVAHGSGEVRLDVLGNDSDPDSDPLVVVDNTQATIGSVECASDGCTFVPPAGYDGPYPQTTKFSYTVGDGRGGTAEAEVEVTLIANQPPVAADDRASTRFPKEVVISVTGNDVDPDGDALRVISLTPLVPFRGGVSCAADRCTYRPPSNFSGSESFRYTITDDHGNGTSSATVTVRVLGENHAPDALDDDVTASTSSNTRILLLGNDRDLDEDPFRLIDWSDATGTVDCSDRACIYTPAEGAADGSEDSFTYTITDDLGGYDTATVHIVVHENQPPVAVADVFEGTIDHKATVNVVANDDDPEHDPLLIVRKTGGAHGSVYCGDTCTYTLDPAYAGPIPVTDTFTYTITDGKADHQSTASVSVTLNANRPPVARDDEATAHGSAPLLLALLGNDTDDDRDPLSIVAVTSPNVGCNVALVCRYAAP
ncbi:MAG TPA: Ig-like domain-containing protein, partial [Desertimonas sp.]|nr:Ig-like domain-containing protein [Desertimonas sp.]